MRIKNGNLYRHIKEKNILPMPAFSTLNRYIRSVDCAYGFQEALFKTLKTKVPTLENEQKRELLVVSLIQDAHRNLYTENYANVSVNVHGYNLKWYVIKQLGLPLTETTFRKMGILQIDEIKLSQAVTFDKASLELQGLVTLDAEHTKQFEFGDHALVFQFQPFRGTWVQALGCFLTKSNANAETLTKLSLECILKVEDCGLFIDAICTDGARWNRQMWEKFGATPNKPWSKHPVEIADDIDDNCRKLWFISDFPHLLKCMRNCVVSKRILKTPSGEVNLKYWEILLREEERQPGLRYCPNISESLVHPKPFEKMNVGKAFKFFGATLAAGMKAYEAKGVKDFAGRDETVAFIRKVNSMADVMNSNTPHMALKPNSAGWKTLEDFLDYFCSLETASVIDQYDSHEKLRKTKNVKAEVFSKSTDEGLVATITAAMEITNMLVTKYGWQFVMTARLNQDALERFFGLIRGSSADSHPNPRKFIQVYRLLSTYSLVKPQKGSNITGGEILSSLFDIKDVNLGAKAEKDEEFIRRLDNFIEKGENLEFLGEVIRNEDHNYTERSVDKFSLNYVGGYIVRKARKFTDCQQCIAKLTKQQLEATENDILIKEKTFGYLLFPSEELMAVISPIEETIMEVFSKQEKHTNFIFTIIEYLKNARTANVGCILHYRELTKNIMKFYIFMRMHFLCKKWNEENAKMNEKQRHFRKKAHLT